MSSTKEKVAKQRREASKRWREKNKKYLAKMKRRWFLNRSDETKANQKAYQRQWEKDNRIRKEAYRIRSKFKLSSIDEAEKLVRRREGTPCECCGRSFKLHFMRIDHCHKSGSIRGIICHTCNIALGQINDNVAHLKQLITYLEAHNELSNFK